MNLSVNNNGSENKRRGPNYGVSPASSEAGHSFSMNPRTVRPTYYTPSNQASCLVNEKPSCSSSSAGYHADGQLATKKSIVITNSNLSSATPSHSLCRVEFQNDKISLALPPGITWEEIQAPPLTEWEVSNLLHFTTQINFQLKKKKKRMRNYRNDVASLNPPHRNFVDTRPCTFVSNRNQSAKKNYFDSKPIPPSKNISVKTKATESKLNQTPPKSRKEVVIQENEVNVVEPSVLAKSPSPKKNQESVEKPVSMVHIGDKCKKRIEEILKLRKPEIINPEIIEALERFMLLSSSSPFAKGFNDKLNSSQSSIPSSSRNNRDYDSTQVDSRLKELMSLSWTGSDDGGEAETSKRIFEDISNQVENFDDKPMDCTKNTPKKKKKKDKRAKIPADPIKTENEPTEETVEVFEDYYDDLTIQEGLKNGTMYQDILRINTKNWREAFVSCSVDDRDIFIDGIKNRNRALDGDEVVVELLPEKQTEVSEDGIQKPATQKGGKVVRIIKENHPRTAVGTLKTVYNKKKMSIFHSPIDPRLPRIKIAINQCISKVKLRYLQKNMVYLAKITSWESTLNAEGIILKEIGDEEDPEVETKCILFENLLDVTPFKSPEKFLPVLPYDIPADEINWRLDIRDRCVFTIDPPGAKDLDDALSCRVLPNNNIEVGIHIADVTHFLKPDTPLDLHARERATSVYLTEKVYHMLPIDLCELCSLTPGEDKLAFSVFVEFDEEANVIGHHFSKTVLRSCVQLMYSHAQDVIENFSESYEPKSFPPVLNGFSANDCVLNICMLQKLASVMRKRRFAGGALRIDQPKIVFNLDEDRLPCSFSLYVGQECNWLIEEFMLLANILAANKTLESFPKTALLRIHASPKEKSLSSAVEYLEKVGIFIDTTDAGSIYQSMTQYEGSDEIGMARMTVITNFLVKPMMRALYVCASKDTDPECRYRHYALNTSCYTHFTSPIRRYPDVVVHRFLAASLGYSEAPSWSPDDIQKIANNCNTKKNNSKKASETSAELYLKIYLERCGPIKVRAVVIDVKERCFELMDLTTRTINRILVNKIQGTQKVEFENESVPSVKVTWKNDPEPLEQIIQIFTIVDVELSYLKTSGQRLQNKIQVTLLKPVS